MSWNWWQWQKECRLMPLRSLFPEAGMVTLCRIHLHDEGRSPTIGRMAVAIIFL